MKATKSADDNNCEPPPPVVSPQPSGTIRVGPAGWSYEDWKGVVYPSRSKGFDQLAFLASYFDTIEINSPFYRIPPDSHPRSWLRRVAANERFKFTSKLFRGFTHDRQFPSPEEVAAFRLYLDCLSGEGRFGALLLQFPWSFKDGPEARERLLRVLETFRDYPKVVEVRHASFHSESFETLLRDHDTGLVNIDQPLFHDSIRPAGILTSPTGYVRFHGRNYEKWFEHEESWERYNYLYDQKELAPWIDRIRAMRDAKEIYVITNNHFRGQAIVNALEIRQMLGEQVEIPEVLKAAYGQRFAE